MTDLKQVLVDALTCSSLDGFTAMRSDPSILNLIDADGEESVADFNLDALTRRLRDHFLDREKVRAALAYALNRDDDYWLSPNPDLVLDRLIEGLAGGGSGS